MKKILVVDDSDDVRENIVDLLEANNFEVLAANNGVDGYKLAIENRPDLIIADIMMPGMDGYELLQKLNEDYQTQNIPFIFLSAKSSTNDIRMGMNIGADDYITKPFSVNDILTAIEVRLMKKDKIDKVFEKAYMTISSYIPHELRTPLSAMIGFTDILIDEFDTIDPAEAKELLLKVNRSSTRLHKLIEKFILLSEAESMNANKQDYVSDFDQTVCLNEGLVNLVGLGKKQLLELTNPLKISFKDTWVKIKNAHLTIILGEIIENAFKFSYPQEAIEVYTINHERHVTICIKNSGRGMSQYEIDNTAPFVQHNRQFYEQQGLGLGLMIARRLSDFYSAKLSIESIPGGYTTVSLKLQKANPNSHVH